MKILHITFVLGIGFYTGSVHAVTTRYTWPHKLFVTGR